MRAIRPFAVFAAAAITGSVLIASPAAAAVGPQEEFAPVGPSGFDWETVVYNGSLYFIADDGQGDDLWVTTGAVGSATSLDLNPTGGADPAGFTIVNGTLYFTADNGVDGNELHFIDSSGAVGAYDIEVGSGGSAPAELTAFDGSLYFAATTTAAGTELWMLDGSGIAVSTGSTARNPDSLLAYNGFLYFSADDGVNAQLWRTDGTSPATEFAVLNATGFANPKNLAVAGGRLYFLANDGASAPFNYELFTTDGLTAPVQLTTDLSSINGYQYFAVVGDVLYYSGGPASIGQELGRTTGGAPPTYFDINPGTASSDPAGFISFQGQLYFGAATASNGYELMRTTGTSAPTLAADIRPGTDNSYPYSFATDGTTLFFAASGVAAVGYPLELWRFDGTTATQASTVNPTGDADVFSPTLFGGFVYFIANDGGGKSVWRIGADITAAQAPALPDTGAGILLPGAAAILLLLAGATTLLAAHSRSKAATPLT